MARKVAESNSKDSKCDIVTVCPVSTILTMLLALCNCSDFLNGFGDREHYPTALVNRYIIPIFGIASVHVTIPCITFFPYVLGMFQLV